eukprot:SAG31_NODE_50673_length_109_cov_20.700000_1_plen_36_part_11
MPNDAQEVLIVDPSTDTADVSTITGLSSATNKWTGG